MYSTGCVQATIEPDMVTSSCESDEDETLPPVTGAPIKEPATEDSCRIDSIIDSRPDAEFIKKL